MKLIYILSFILGISTSCFSQDFNYLPSKVDGHQIVKYKEFTLSYNEAAEQPDWVAYELTKQEVLIKKGRSDHFKTDEKITTGSATQSDYTSTGFDKGHICPAADCKSSQQAYEESYLMSNMSPQIPSFNRGIWKDLEAWVRSQAIKYEKIYVVTAPVFIFGSNLGRMGKNEVTIPSYFYKVILRQNPDGKYKSIAFLLPHVGAVGEIQDYIVPVNTIETLTGIDFFPALGKNENRIESQFEPGSWGF